LDQAVHRIIESLSTAVAVYAADGRQVSCSPAFAALIAGMLPGEGAEGLAELPRLATLLPLPEALLAGGGQAEVVSPAGVIATFTLARLDGDGGWTLAAEDVTERRLAERKFERTQKVALIALADLAENRDNKTGEHILRVARLTHEIARWLRHNGHYADVIDDAFLRHVGLVSVLHDVGKVAIPDAILLKEGLLTPEERQVMEEHAVSGAAILRKADTMLAGNSQFHLAAEIAEFHHERWDGTGYPHRLAGEQIPLAARIVAAADVYDALTTERPYKAAWTDEKSRAFLAEQAGKSFDAQVVKALDAVITERAQARVIAWTPQMATGIGVIDRDHRVLLTLVNQMSCPGTIDDRTAVEFILDELLGYTVLHFNREEALMAAAGYPQLKGHRAIHQQMVSEVKELQASLATFTPEVGHDLQQFLADWLTHHILEEDRLYIPYVMASGRQAVGE
jgi:hemerythrin-like metal-binding protein